MNVGERIGDYEIVEVLGAGGMGEVFKVRNSLSGRIEAMKVLHANLAGDKELAERFQREIRVQAALDHPHIARLNTAQLLTNQQGASQLVMVMEYVEGESLAQILQRGPISLTDCVQYACQVLDALGYAHEHGVVHRDIKPANIMCTRQGVIKLMDFGIARMAQDQKLTDTGKTVGSLHYMSPEQIRGTEPDPRSDIYSFGITLYEMATGKKPFDGASNYSIMSAHLQQEPVPPVNVTAGVPEALSQIILMAIAKDAGQRFQTAKAFASALQSVQPGPTMSMVTPSAPAPSRMAPPPPPPVMAPTVPVGAGPAPISNLPNYGGAQMPPPTIAPAPRSMRGLYMVIGSLVTILVLGGVAYEAPKYFGAGANTKTEPISKAPTPAVVTTPAPSTPPPAQPVDAAIPPPSQDNTTPSTPPVPSTTVQSPIPVVTRPASMPQTRPQTPPQTSAQVTPVPATTTQQTSPVVPTTQQAPPPVATQAVAPPVSRELNEAREQYNELAVRATASRSSLDSITQQMRNQGGLGLRRDIIEAQSRLDVQMKEAMDSIRSGDVNGAREHLQYATGNLQVIDKFLGH